MTGLFVLFYLAYEGLSHPIDRQNIGWVKKKRGAGLQRPLRDETARQGEMLKTVTCDDELPALELMGQMLAETGDVEIMAQCQSVEEALDIINAGGIDLIVFDIEMPGLSGVDAYDRITTDKKPLLVFATAHPEYAVEAFGIDAIDYILKPFDAERVRKAVEKALRLSKLIDASDEASEVEVAEPLADEIAGVLKIRDAGRVHFIAYGDVIWIEAAGDYSLVHTHDREAAIRVPIKALESKLPTDQFLRIHRSTIVSKSHIQEIQKLPKGEAQITLTSGAVVKGSRSFREAIERLTNGV
jgi:two-component system, LytTR family, response regulator